jgi:hypothetical protein
MSESAKVLDRFGRQRYDAAGKPLYRPVRLLPNAAALAWELSVLDPKTYNLPTRPVKSTRRRKPRPWSGASAKV